MKSNKKQWVSVILSDFEKFDIETLDDDALAGVINLAIQVSYTTCDADNRPVNWGSDDAEDNGIEQYTKMLDRLVLHHGRAAYEVLMKRLEEDPCKSEQVIKSVINWQLENGEYDFGRDDALYSIARRTWLSGQRAMEKKPSPKIQIVRRHNVQPNI